MLLTLLAAGCTMSFTYNHLDWLIPWYVDDYVDLSRQQRQLLQGQLGPVLQWHREEELERYLELLDQIEADLAGEVTAAQVEVNDLSQSRRTASEEIRSCQLNVAQ